MSDQFVAEIRIFPFSYPPKGWAFCNGQLLAISQNSALFSLIGTTYGGDGRSTFGLPNIPGSAVIGPGQGQGLSAYTLGERSGNRTVTLTSQEMPQHTHPLRAHSQDPADLNAPNPQRSLARSDGGNAYGPPDGFVTAMSGNAIAPVGGNAAHNNMQPVLVMNYCIALQGIFPPRP